MITTRAELIKLLSTPDVAKLYRAGGGTVEDLADAILDARNGLGDPPAGERWDAVESSLAREGVRPVGHVGRCPILELETFEYILMRLRAAEELLNLTRPDV